MRAVTDEELRLMDSILRDLIVKNRSTMDFEAIHPTKKDDVHNCIQELLSEELIVMFAEDGGGTFSITTEGQRFIKHTSFEKIAKDKKDLEEQEKKQKEQQQQRTETEFRWKKTDEKRKSLTIAFALITVGCTIYNIYIQIGNSQKANDAQLALDSVKTSLSLANEKIDSLIRAQNAITLPLLKASGQKQQQQNQGK